MKVTVAVLDKQGNNVAPKVLAVLKEFSVEQLSHFGLVSPQKSVLSKNFDLLSKQSPDSSTSVGYASSKSTTASGYEFLRLHDAAIVFQGRIYSSVPKSALIKQLAKEPQHCETMLQTLIEKADGDYMFLVVKDGWVAAGRDPVGVQPLYYGENREVAAIATNRKSLWKLGIENPASFPPGNLAFVNREGFQFKPVKTLSFSKPKPITLGDAAQRLQVLIEESIKRRTLDVKEVAVAFSGGLDSSFVAFLASKIGLKVKLLYVSMENESETEAAIAVSEMLNLPLQVHLFKDSDVEKTLPKVVGLIEEADPVKVSVGLPFYWIAEKSAEAGLRVVLAGQGADELFGGYQRYVTEYCKDGSEKVLKTMFSDVVNIHKSNLERDLKITSYHDIELRLPFASFDVAEFAVSLTVECKIEPRPDTLRKLVLRRVALAAGMPRSVVDKPKKAVQYSTGMNDAVKRIAKKNGKTVSEFINDLFQESKR
ncbi:MAG TPA: asparagine synthetase B [Candidatus Limnocylindrales bacterium]|nr:asparagine synthetase B [Candidatus Limnocylindrales bacterium]